MAGKITAADAVNQITKKFHGRVEFRFIDDLSCWVRIGPNWFAIYYREIYEAYELTSIDLAQPKTKKSPHSRWVEGVLNNYKRNEAGEMVSSAPGSSDCG